MKLENIILPGRDPESRWDVVLEAGRITSIHRSSTFSSDSAAAPASLLLPSLCHPHVHLDKAYLLTCNRQHHHPKTTSHQRPDESSGNTEPGSRSEETGQSDDRHLGSRLKELSHPTYTDLSPQSGSFSEALTFTSRAKHRYTPTDLHLRGSQLLATSLVQGVTSCRAFVELDHVTGHQCIDAAVALKRAFNNKFRLQICAFAQDPIFSTEYGEENRRILDEGLEEYGTDVEVLGTTPYVEETVDASTRNIQWAIETALEHALHLDFHLDYNLDETRAPMVWDVLRLLKQARWNERAQKGKTIVLGHCSRLTMCSDSEMVELAKEVKESELPVYFVALPTSDLFMMGRPLPVTAKMKPEGDQESLQQRSTAHRPRGTLQVVDMIRRFGLSACLAVNNVGNAFTPWGTGDPLSLASMGVGIYQAGTEDDANVLFECVSSRARQAIGLSAEKFAVGHEMVGDESSAGNLGTDCALSDTLDLEEGCAGPFLLVRNEEWVGCPGHLGLEVPARQRVSVRDVVWDPPEASLRQVIY